MSTISATDTEVQKPVNVIFQQTLLRNARARAPYFAGTQAGSIQRQGGTATIKWRRYNTALDNASGIDLTTTALSELTGTAAYGQSRTADVVHFTDVTATVSKYGQYFILNEEVEIFNFNGTFDGIVATLGISAGRSVNALQRNVVEDNATKVYANSVASDGAVVAVTAAADIQRVINTLNRNSAITFSPMSTGDTALGTGPVLPSYWAICHPDVAHDVSKLTGFKSVETYAGQIATVPFEFGYFGQAGQGVRFIQTEDASIDTDAGGTNSGSTRGTSDTDLYTISIYGMDALGSVGVGQSYGTAIYESGDEIPAIELLVGTREASAADPFAELRTVAWKAWHSGAVLNANWARALRVGATAQASY